MKRLRIETKTKKEGRAESPGGDKRVTSSYSMFKKKKKSCLKLSIARIFVC